MWGYLTVWGPDGIRRVWLPGIRIQMTSVLIHHPFLRGLSRQDTTLSCAIPTSHGQQGGTPHKYYLYRLLPVRAPKTYFLPSLL
jgi:hypothetical protein